MSFWFGPVLGGKLFVLVIQYVILSDSSYISSGGNTATTRRLSIPSGKGSGDFLAGKISDDTNPLPSLDLGNDQFTELEWSVELTEHVGTGDEIEFRVTANGVELDTYTYIPKWTVSITGEVVIPIFMYYYKKLRG